MKVEKVSTNTQLFIKLDAGRNDVVVTSRLEGQLVINELGYHDIQAVEPPLARIGLYHFLHKKNKALVPQIEKVLKEMETSGRLAAIRKDVIAALLHRDNN